MKHKFYFAGSIRAGRDDGELYRQIIELLKEYGVVLTEHVGDTQRCETEETKLTDQQIHDRDVAWIEDCTVFIGEVTAPSLGVGYEIGKAIDLYKLVICLYRPQEGKKLSAMINGLAEKDELLLVEYQDIEELKELLPYLI